MRRATTAVKRVAPVVVELYRRWEKMPPAERERHRRRATDAAARVRAAARTGAEQVRAAREPDQRRGRRRPRKR